jgi:hypothetical protein
MRGWEECVLSGILVAIKQSDHPMRDLDTSPVAGLIVAQATVSDYPMGVKTEETDKI